MSTYPLPTYFVTDDTETIDETLTRINQSTGHRKGNGRCIELILPELSLILEKQWLAFFPMEFKQNWIRQLQDNRILNEIPDLGPATSETKSQNFSAPTTDNPTAVTRTSIRYRIMRTEAGGFKRKMFSDTKELMPRLRFNIVSLPNAQGIRSITKVMAKTTEHLVEWEISARNNIEADYFYKCLEYVFYCKRKMISDLGVQRAIPLGSPRHSGIDDQTKMHKKILSVYFRNEEYFYEEPVVEITDASLNWKDINLEYSRT